MTDWPVLLALLAHLLMVGRFAVLLERRLVRLEEGLVGVRRELEAQR